MAMRPGEGMHGATRRLGAGGMCVALAWLGAMAALLAAGPADAAVLSKEESLFRIPGLGFQSFAADPHTGHFFIPDTADNRIEEYTPWGRLVKAIGWDVAPGAVNETQEVRVRASEGTFRLSFEGKQTAELSYRASGEEVQAALNSLESIEGPGGEVSVTESVGSPDGAVPYLYVVAFKGALAGADVEGLEIEDGAEALAGGEPTTVAEARTRADGHVATAGPETCTPESGCQAGSAGEGAGQIGGEAGKVGRIEGLAVGPEGDLYVGEGGPDYRVQVFSPSGRFLRAFGGDTIRDGAAGEGVLSPGSAEIGSVATTEKDFRVGQPIEGTGIEAGTMIAALGEGTITLSEPAGPAATGAPTELTVPPGTNNVPANETQTVSLSSNVSGGSFRLEFRTPTPDRSEFETEAIPWNAGAGEVEAKLNALPDMEPVGGEVEVSGPAGGPWEVEFKGARYAGGDVMRLGGSPGGLLTSDGNRGSVAISSESGYEVCEALGECQAGAVEGARKKYKGGSYTEDPYGPLALAPGALYLADGLRIERFDPATGALLGELPDPDGARTAESFNGEGVAHLATGSSGPLYFDFPAESGGIGSEHVYALDRESGALVRTQTLNPEASGKPGALALGADGALYAVDKGRGVRYDHVVGFDAAGHQLFPSPAAEAECEAYDGTATDQRAFCEEVLGIQAGRGGSFGALGIGPAGDLYLSGRAEGEGYLHAYGPPPLPLESPPPAPPAIEGQFAASVYLDGAEVRAKINPRFFSGALGTTTYYVQYASAACVQAGGWGAPCVRQTPAPPGRRLGGGAVGRGLAVAVSLEGLDPATSYRYRFAAEGTGAPGEPVFGAGGEPGKDGADASFTTPRSPGAPEACPANEAYRSGPSAALPDCRAYEMVSPTDKGGGDIVNLENVTVGVPDALKQAAVSGEKLAYATYKSFGDAASAPYVSEYVAARRPAGWRSHAVSPPHNRPLGGATAQTYPEFLAFSPDLCQAWVYPRTESLLSPDAVPGYFNLYRRSDSECGGPGYEALSTAAPSVIREKAYLEVQGSARGGAATFIAAAGQPQAAGEREAPALEDQGEVQLYERSGGRLRFLCRLPDGSELADSGCSAGSSAPSGSLGQGYEAHLDGAIAAGGERVFWSASGRGAKAPIYLRSHPSRGQSPPVSGPAGGSGELDEGSKRSKTCSPSAAGWR